MFGVVSLMVTLLAHTSTMRIDERYLQFLQNNLQMLLRNVPVQLDAMWFHQDGVGSHNYHIVINYLTQTYPGNMDCYQWSS